MKLSILIYQFQKPGRSFVNNEEHGLVFRSFIYLFEELQKRSEDANYVIKASYLEIYNEKVIFLMNEILLWLVCLKLHTPLTS